MKDELLTGDADRLRAEIERLQRENAQLASLGGAALTQLDQTVRLQAQYERDCAVEDVKRLVVLLKQCVKPVSNQLTAARLNLDLHKGYSARERRYGYEIEQLERLQKEIDAVTRPAADVGAPPSPDVLAGALQDKVHEDTGAVRAGQAVKQGTRGEKHGS